MKKTILVGLAIFSFLPLQAIAQKGPQPVIVATARKDTFSDQVEALGTLRANETVTLTATVTEPVTSINFEDGQRVEAGDILVEITNTEEKAELEAERAAVEETRRQLERLGPLVKSGAASKSALDERQGSYDSAKARFNAVKSRISDRIITAPFSGIVGMRNISVGAVLQPGMKITTLDDDSVMKLDFSVPSIFLPALKLGLEIVATSNAFTDHKFKGTILSIDSQIDPVTRSITVRALIPNEDKILKPGLLMSVEIMKDPREALVIPEEAIVPEARKNFVFSVQSEGGKSFVKKREIEIGARRPGEVEVKKGLSEGEKIVTHGAMNLVDKAEVVIKAEDDGSQSLNKMLGSNQKESAGKAP